MFCLKYRSITEPSGMIRNLKEMMAEASYKHSEVCPCIINCSFLDQKAKDSRQFTMLLVLN